MFRQWYERRRPRRRGNTARIVLGLQSSVPPSGGFVSGLVGVAPILHASMPRRPDSAWSWFLRASVPPSPGPFGSRPGRGGCFVDASIRGCPRPVAFRSRPGVEGLQARGPAPADRPAPPSLHGGPPAGRRPGERGRPRRPCRPGWCRGSEPGCRRDVSPGAVTPLMFQACCYYMMLGPKRSQLGRERKQSQEEGDNEREKETW